MNPTVKERMLHAVTTTLWAPLMLPEEEQVMVPIKKQMDAVPEPDTRSDTEAQPPADR